MTDQADYLKETREKSLGDDSTVSEAELHATHENIKEAWQRVQDVKRQITEAKRKAIDAVDAQFKEELVAAESDYALQITITRW